MEIHPSVAPIAAKNVTMEDVRRSVTYHPTIWGDYFLGYDSITAELLANEEEKVEKQKEEVRKVLATIANSIHKMELIDAIQRLGVAYHFEKEIDKFLQHMHETYTEFISKQDNDLCTIALCFRLLRQQGYNVSSDLFKKFVDHQGKFEESLMIDVRGLLSLYEAAHFATHGDEILDKALKVCSFQLESMLPHMNSSLAAQVSETLKTPVHKRLTRLGARKFISTYQEDKSHNETLLNFAKLDFNSVQKVHQKELSELTRWWKALDFCNKLPFARDRLVECYFWVLGIYFEPQYHIGRKLLTKVLIIGSTIDDIYDVYGTLDELKLFTDAVRRWDISAMEELPPYMKICYQALLDVYDEMGELEKREGSYHVHYAKEEMKKMIISYYQEAVWLYNNHIPTMEEYMKVALLSAGYIMIAATSLVGMGDLVAKEDFDWVAREPLMVQAASIIARLMDDMGGYGLETKLSAVGCYMSQYGVSKEVAFDELEKQVFKAWKDINQECLHPTSVSKPVLTRIVNSTRVIHVVYEDEDGYSNSKTRLKGLIEFVLIEPVAI